MVAYVLASHPDVEVSREWETKHEQNEATVFKSPQVPPLRPRHIPVPGLGRPGGPQRGLASPKHTPTQGDTSLEYGSIRKEEGETWMVVIEATQMPATWLLATS